MSEQMWLELVETELEKARVNYFKNKDQKSLVEMNKWLATYKTLVWKTA